MKWRTYGCALLSDAVLWLIFFAELVLFQLTHCGGLPGLWTFAIFKWLSITTWTMWVDDKPTPALRGFVALMCLLLPAYESGRTLCGFSTFGGGSVPEVSAVALAQLCSIAACALWEVDLGGLGGLGTGRLQAGAPDPGSVALLRRVMRYFMPDYLYLILAFSFLTLGVACETYIPLYQGRVIDMLRGQLYQKHFLKQLGWLALFSLGSAVFAALRGGAFMWILARLNRRVKTLLYSNRMQQDVQYFEDNKPGSLASRLHSDVEKMGRAVAMNCNVLARSTIKTALTLRLMLRLSWQLTLLAAVQMRLVALIQNRYNAYSRETKEQVQACHAENSRLATQALCSIRVVRSCRAEDCEARAYGQALDHMRDIKRHKGIYSATFLLLRRLVNVGMTVLILVQGRSLISSGQLSVGDLLAFLLYQTPLSHSINEFLYGMGEMSSTSGVISKVLNDLERTPAGRRAGALAPDRLEGRISFQNVTFAYPGSLHKPVLQSLSMELRPGKMTALVGPTGGGKTTCVSLLKRLYEPLQGEILLDGQPLHCYQHKYLHQKVTLVPQNPVLFSGSVRANIGYGLEDCPQERLEAAARRACAHSFIEALDHKYDADVGECGVRLGAGHRQCVAIARALVRTPRVVILDEATSQLDIDIQQAVARAVLAEGATVLVVAHQLKTVEHADHIVFMAGGAIVEQGTHRELLERGGPYYRSHQEVFH